jgi:hypothetical protein
MTHDEMIEVIQAHKDGKVIQVNTDGAYSSDGPNRGWLDAIERELMWNFELNDYRVKPAPKEYWMVPHADKLGFMVFGSSPKNLEPDLYSVELDFANTIHVVTVVKGE